MVGFCRLNKNDLAILGFANGTVKENKQKLRQKLQEYGIDSKKYNDVHGLRRAISKEFHKRKRESIARSKTFTKRKYRITEIN